MKTPMKTLGLIRIIGAAAATAAAVVTLAFAATVGQAARPPVIDRDADDVLFLYTSKLPYSVRTNSTNGRRMVNDAATLESYNKGALTPGCGG